jgi:hypothetical protein
MVANEMFLDSSVQRGSVVSHAKLLNYIPKSAVAPVATVNVVVYGVTTSTLTMPKFTGFVSEAIEGENYTFVTKDATTVNVTANTAIFNGLEIYQGLNSSYSFTFNSTTNPKAIFTLQDTNIDTGTLAVTVQESSSNLAFQTYLQASDYLNLSPASQVYFLQEGMDGFYQIYFGDGILGKSLTNNNVVNVSYITTSGTAAFGANSFTITQSVGGFSNTVTRGIISASQGADKETIDSIKYSAPKAFAAQGRAVTKDDYIYLIQNNTSNFPVDSVSVWGGEENDPPVYGQIFCAIKPSGGFTLTPTQKEKIITDVIKPISVLTVVPTIVDPDYNYVKLRVKVLYDPKKTTLNGGQVQQAVINSINTFATNSLNTFNSTFKTPELSTAIQTANPSIITNETDIRLQKKFYPSLNTKTTYYLNFGVALRRNYFNAGLSSYPDFSTVDVTATNSIRTGVFFEEVPSIVGGVASINVLNQGYSYTKRPTVTITGDGTGAEAYAVLVSGRISNIVVTNPGYDYTQAVVTITNAAGDTTGALAYAAPVLTGSIGTLRTYYYLNNVKQILDNDAGTINYTTGLVTLTNFAPTSINNDLGQFIVSVVPDSTIVSSTYNRIVALDQFDPDAITVTVTATQ